MIRSKSSLHKREIAKIAENCISKDETVVKEKECEFTLSFCGNIHFYEFAHTVFYKFKYFNEVKTSFLPLCMHKTRITHFTDPSVLCSTV